MPRPVAKEGVDGIKATCTHVVQPPPPGTPTPQTFSFKATFGRNLSPDVYAENRKVAFVTSIATLRIPLIPKGGTFVKPPGNSGRVIMGSPTVYANGKAIARDGDMATSCNDPVDLPNANVTARGTVYADD